MPVDTERLTRFFRNTTLCVVIIALIGFGVLLFFVVTRGDEPETLRAHAYIALLCELMVAAIIYIAARLILGFPKELSRSNEFETHIVKPILTDVRGNHENMLKALRDNNQTVHPKIDGIKWESLFEGADEILLLVQGWD